MRMVGAGARRRGGRPILHQTFGIYLHIREVGSRFRNASVPTPPDQITRSVLRKSSGDYDPVQDGPPDPPGRASSTIGAPTRDPWRRPVDPPGETPHAAMPIFFLLNHCRGIAARPHRKMP